MLERKIEGGIREWQPLGQIIVSLIERKKSKVEK